MAKIPDVISGGTIESAWGNAIRDQTVQRFATKAERDAAIPSGVAGQFCYIAATPNVHYWFHDGTTWRGFATMRLSRTFDGSALTITAAELGFTTIIAAGADIDWQGQSDARVNLGGARVLNNTVQIRAFSTPATVAPWTFLLTAAGSPILVSLWAFGT